MYVSVYMCIYVCECVYVCDKVLLTAKAFVIVVKLMTRWTLAMFFIAYHVLRTIRVQFTAVICGGCVTWSRVSDVTRSVLVKSQVRC